MKEVESKYLVEDKEQLMNYLKDAEFVKEKHQKDIYYDTELGDLNAKGYYIRIRNDKRFDFKYNLNWEDNHEYCHEDNFTYPLIEEEIPAINKVLQTLSLNQIDKAGVTEIASKNNLIPLVPIEKHRKYYKKNGFTFCVDDVKDLGFFVEIEKIVPDEEVEQARESIKKEMQQFDFKRIPTGYIELYLKRNHPKAYKRGRYKVSDDIWK